MSCVQQIQFAPLKKTTKVSTKLIESVNIVKGVKYFNVVSTHQYLQIQNNLGKVINKQSAEGWAQMTALRK